MAAYQYVLHLSNLNHQYSKKACERQCPNFLTISDGMPDTRYKVVSPILKQCPVMRRWLFFVFLRIELMQWINFDLVNVTILLCSSRYAAIGWLLCSLFFMKCLWIACIGSSGASWWGIQMSSPRAFCVLDQRRCKMHAPFCEVDSVMSEKDAWQRDVETWCSTKTFV